MNNELLVVAGSVPVTLFLLSSIGASAAAITGRDDAAIRQALAVASVAMVAAAAATGSYAATFTTTAAVGFTLWSMRGVWNVPSLSDVIPS